LRLWSAWPAVAAGAQAPPIGDYLARGPANRHWDYAGAFLRDNAARYHRIFFLSRLAMIPISLLGAILVYLFSKHQWFFTVGKYVPFEQDPVANFQAMFLPALTLSVFGIAVIARTGRDAVQAVTQGLYVTAAVAAGESRWQIIRRHVFRNASIPVLTVTTTFAGYILGGAVIIEMLFSLPGVGLYVYTGINNRDYTVVQAGVLLAAAIFVVINIVTDILYGVLDPRIGARRARS
jgi:peptide/nickel transport system permease protein